MHLFPCAHNPKQKEHRNELLLKPNTLSFSCVLLVCGRKRQARFSCSTPFLSLS